MYKHICPHSVTEIPQKERLPSWLERNAHPFLLNRLVGIFCRIWKKFLFKNYALNCPTHTGIFNMGDEKKANNSTNKPLGEFWMVPERCGTVTSLLHSELIFAMTALHIREIIALFLLPWKPTSAALNFYSEYCVFLSLSSLLDQTRKSIFFLTVVSS